MAPGPVIDAPATESEVEQQIPSVDETTLKKKPQPEVTFFLLIYHSFQDSFMFLFCVLICSFNLI